MQVSSEPSDSISSSPVASPDLSKGVEGGPNVFIVQCRSVYYFCCFFSEIYHIIENYLYFLFLVEVLVEYSSILSCNIMLYQISFHFLKNLMAVLLHLQKPSMTLTGFMNLSLNGM